VRIRSSLRLILFLMNLKIEQQKSLEKVLTFELLYGLGYRHAVMEGVILS